MELRKDYPKARTLPILESKIRRGPYYDDARRLINKHLLLSEPINDNHAKYKRIFSAVWTRMAIQRRFLPPPEAGIDTSSWFNVTLDQLREFMAYTPVNERCLCRNTPLKEIDDHWPECDVGKALKRLRRAGQYITNPQPCDTKPDILEEPVFV